MMSESKLRGVVFTLLLAMTCWASPGVQARDVAPQPGIWAIAEENNGSPGRGFQIDVQNDVLVLNFYGYTPSGSARWWLAAGTFRPGFNSLTMDLGAYEGGMTFGDPRKNAAYLGSEGTVRVSFSSPVSGEICLPGEACKSIIPLNFGWGNDARELIGTWHVVGRDAGPGGPLVAYEFNFDPLDAISRPDVIDSVNAKAKWTAGGTSFDASFVCEKPRNPGAWQYECAMRAGFESMRLVFSVSRNGLRGEMRDETGAMLLGTLTGFRVESENGRQLVPN
jgi:hypothetical protein